MDSWLDIDHACQLTDRCKTLDFTLSVGIVNHPNPILIVRLASRSDRESPSSFFLYVICVYLELPLHPKSFACHNSLSLRSSDRWTKP
jgi:hypothetical protein